MGEHWGEAYIYICVRGVDILLAKFNFLHCEKKDTLHVYTQLLTRTSNGERFSVLDLYIGEDLLGLADDEGKDGSKLRESLLAAMLPSDAALWRKDTAAGGGGGARTAAAAAAEVSSPAASQQASLARMVNAMASVKRGRDYLGLAQKELKKTST